MFVFQEANPCLSVDFLPVHVSYHLNIKKFKKNVGTDNWFVYQYTPWASDSISSTTSWKELLDSSSNSSCCDKSGLLEVETPKSLFLLRSFFRSRVVRVQIKVFPTVLAYFLTFLLFSSLFEVHSKFWDPYYVVLIRTMSISIPPYLLPFHYRIYM